MKRKGWIIAAVVLAVFAGGFAVVYADGLPGTAATDSNTPAAAAPAWGTAPGAGYGMMGGAYGHGPGMMGAGRGPGYGMRGAGGVDSDGDGVPDCYAQRSAMATAWSKLTPEKQQQFFKDAQKLMESYGLPVPPAWGAPEAAPETTAR